MLEEIKISIKYMRSRLEEGQGNLASAMCRLSLPMSEWLLDWGTQWCRRALKAEKRAAEIFTNERDVISAYAVKEDAEIKLINAKLKQENADLRYKIAKLTELKENDQPLEY